MAGGAPAAGGPPLQPDVFKNCLIYPLVRFKLFWILSWLGGNNDNYLPTSRNVWGHRQPWLEKNVISGRNGGRGLKMWSEENLEKFRRIWQTEEEDGAGVGQLVF